ncbi:MAG: WS/DGAT domain-containing protein [Undibacterium sp.]|uniref:WS/DGAT domain-containing protein n=1 Tax=Undibacterium sp. TaxID=1914977 RepID=UPI002719E1F7|nr:WS/DGAT domain-containing protein [Undibacterium sp.]MDO8654800.1 WS/DGAT domain-containing protein [Undibacterium sp.]
MTTREFAAQESALQPSAPLSEVPITTSAAASKMTRRDFAWHRMDTDKNLMVINSILMFEGPLDMDRLVSTIAHRLPNYPRFTQKVVTRLGQPRWIEDTGFDILAHIQLETLAQQVSGTALQQQLTGMAHVPLEKDRPLWHMTVIDQVGAGYAIVFRVHHCITDGLGLIHVLNHLTDDNDSHGKVPAMAGHPHRAQVARQSVCSRLVRCVSLLKVAAHVTRLSLLWPDASTRLKAPLTGAKQLVWLPPIEMERVRTMAKRMGVTLNDVWVAAVSGALREYLSEHGEQLNGRPLRAAVTFNLREKTNAFQLGNEFGLVALELPTNVDDPRQRLIQASKRMNAIKRSHQPQATMAFLSIAGCLPRPLQHFALNLFTSKGSVVLTNIEGPGRSRYLAGSKMTDLICWVPQAGLMGVGFAFISYAGQIQLALFVDTDLVQFPERLMTLTYEAFARLDLATRMGVEEGAATDALTGPPTGLAACSTNAGSAIGLQ